MISEQLGYAGEILRLPLEKQTFNGTLLVKKLSNLIDRSTTQFDKALSETLEFYKAVSLEAA